MASSMIADGSRGGEGGFMLFGVRVIKEEGSFRKSVSMNNLVQYDDEDADDDHHHNPLDDSNTDAAVAVAVAAASGYASDDASGGIRDRKRGVAWSEEEHKLFLLGLQSVGKGDWRGISRNYVKTRTPTQVASHAQKYFLRRNNHNNSSRRRRRSSLFDMKTDEVVVGSSAEDQMQPIQQNKPIIPPHSLKNNPMVITIPSTPTENSLESHSYMQLNQLTNSPKPIMSIPILPTPPPPSFTMANLNLNKTTGIIADGNPALSLNLSISPSQSAVTRDDDEEQRSPSSNHQSTSTRAFQTMSGTFNGGSGGDSIISVA